MTTPQPPASPYQPHSPYGPPRPEYTAPPWQEGPPSPLMHPAGQIPAQDQDLAPLGRRLLARVLDTLVLCLAVAVAILASAGLQMAVAEDGAVYIAAGAVAWAITAALVLGYEPLWTRQFGATIGKQLCDLRVVRAADRSPLSAGTAILRLWITFPLGLTFAGALANIFAPLFTAKRQSLHDMIAKTLVVDARSGPARPGG
jgi:uncharacterized RDD family membrane protein YckC